MKKRIVVPVDGSEAALRALKVAIDLAKQRHCELRLLHVVPKGGVPVGLERWANVEHIHESPQWLYDEGLANSVLTDAEDKIPPEAGVACERVIDRGDPASQIVASGDDAETEMIVMGNRGLSNIASLVLGSVAHKVAHSARCPVVTVT